jgi:hypothetical protein
MKKVLLYAAVAAVTAASCGGGAKHKIITYDAEMKAPAAQYASAGMADSAKIDATGKQAPPPPFILQAGAPQNPDWDKKIIKTAHVSLELNDYNAYNYSIHTKIKSYGAYIAQEQQLQSGQEITNEISIKVPVDKFEDMINSLGGEGVKLIEKTITSEDVTGEVVDTKARMEAKKQVRDRYLDLLKQAKTMKDILDVQQEINSIQEDIESANGRVNYLEHSAAYSTINLKYYQYLNGITAKDAEPSFISNMGTALKAGGSIITNIILFITSLWPLVLTVILGILYFRRWKARCRVTANTSTDKNGANSANSNNA